MNMMPKGNGKWVTDRAQIAATEVMGRIPMPEVAENSYASFVVAKTNEVFV